MIYLQTQKNLKLACFLVSALTLTACSENNVSVSSYEGASSFIPAELRSDCSGGLKAFENSLHILLRNNCTYCHETGSTIAPPHSVANSQASYSYMVTYMNWSDLEASKLIIKVHEAHWIGKPGSETVKTNEAEVRKAIQEWWGGGQKDCPSLGNQVSKPVAFPMDLKDWKRVNVKLPSETETLKNGTLSFEIMIRDKNYLLRKPLFENIDSGVKISRLHVALNGQAYETPFNLVKGVVEPEGEKQSAVLSGYMTAIPIEDSTKDMLSVGFDLLKPMTPFECHHIDTFKKDVVAVMELRRCNRCHGGNGEVGESLAKKRFNMALEEKELCRAFLVRGVGQYTVESPLITYPLRGSNGHSVEIPHEAEVLPTWNNWIKAEKIHEF